MKFRKTSVLAASSGYRFANFQESDLACPSPIFAVEPRSGRSLRCISFWHSSLHPRADQLGLVVAEPAYVCEISVPGFRQPGRHEVRLRN